MQKGFRPALQKTITNEILHHHRNLSLNEEEGLFRKGLAESTRSLQSEMTLRVNDYW